jgi:hypothetical protein
VNGLGFVCHRLEISIVTCSLRDLLPAVQSGWRLSRARTARNKCTPSGTNACLPERTRTAQNERLPRG